MCLSMSLYYGLNRSWYQFYGTGHFHFSFSILSLLISSSVKLAITSRTRANCGAKLMESTSSPLWARPRYRSRYSGKYLMQMLQIFWKFLNCRLAFSSSFNSDPFFGTRQVWHTICFFTIVQMFRYRGLDPRKSRLSVGCLWHSFCLAVWCRTMEQPETGD